MGEKRWLTCHCNLHLLIASEFQFFIFKVCWLFDFALLCRGASYCLPYFLLDYLSPYQFVRALCV